MSYSDVQMIIASQIAYIDFDRDAADYGRCTIEELLRSEMDRAKDERKEQIEKLLERIHENAVTRECGKWKIRDIRDNQATSGMYACLLDTGDGDALVAFRGSESDSWDNIKKDWIESDIGLVNNVLTPQQETAEKYLLDIYNSYGSEYENLGMTGHSLGGNLAEHAAITAPDYMRNKISQCVNLDGPGFSNKYLLAHADDIEKSKGVIDHYQWSWCGRLLNPAPGSNYQTIQANTPIDLGEFIKKMIKTPPAVYPGVFTVNTVMNMLWRHDTYNVVNFDENGNAIPGKPDWLAAALEPIADTIDAALFLITGGFAFILDNTIDEIKKVFENLGELWDRILSLGMAQAEFEMNVNTVNKEIEALQTAIPQLREICNSAERIQKELAFDSVAAGSVKLKLWSLANSIENDAGKLDVYCGKGKECIQCYQTHELKIVDNYG